MLAALAFAIAATHLVVRIDFAARPAGFVVRLSEVILHYLVWLAGLLPVHFLLPPAWRPVATLAAGLGYCWYEVSTAMPIWLVGGLLVFFAISQAARRWPRASLVCFVAWVIAFYTYAPPRLMDLENGLSDVLSFTTDTIKAAIFARLFKRNVIVFYEMWVGRVTSVTLLEYYHYMLGLPFMFNCCTPSFHHFRTSLATAQPALSEAVRRGAKTIVVTTLVALAPYLMIWLRMKLKMELSVRGFEDMLDAETYELWCMILGFQLLYFCRRYSQEQLSVGVWRSLGYNLRDDFTSPLTASSVIEYWRRWNLLWREMLLSMIYYPVVLALARRRGQREPWMIALAAWLTFSLNFIFDFVPRGLYVLFTFPAQMLDFMLSMALYHVTWGTVLAVSLYREARRGTSAPPSTGAWLALKVGFTFWLVGAVRFLDVNRYTVGQKLTILGKAFLLIDP